ncbi:MAG: transporter substrate-binding domain-containing protein [Verrucomicrobia bacterium]|nr:transporter substrate-binding domain-containing protein [Verrucomicrobiota bacterium]MBU4291380.1 transporter substrate-binding domain-containing protein [Verrucomicrobiota bacterium]MBU4497423.1 transporter substrate-binding domain-containing protein [Verrucomicrobiota bacterium]MCG2680078.1 transporter substrate-binding domain-containing protein [Kiritimatiellia bacterium]
MIEKTFWRLFPASCLWGLLLGAGCRPEAVDQQELPATVSASTTYIETGDLEAIKKRGLLRILVQRFEETYLPRDGNPYDHERELAAAFARSIGLKPELVAVESFEELIPALLAGQGDLVAANLTVLESRKKQIAFTAPVGRSREQLVARTNDRTVRKISDLKTRAVAIQDMTSFAETARDLARHTPGLKIQILSGRFSPDAIFDRLAAGKIDLTIMDSNILDISLDYRSDIKPIFDMSCERPLAWGVRPGNSQLLAALNGYLDRQAVTRPREDVYRDDWPGIQKRKTLRVLTRNNEVSYFMWRGEILGFEYDLAREFARQNGLQLEMVVASSLNELIAMLMDGRGDMIASFMAPTEDRARKGLAFSVPYYYSPEIVVARTDDRKLKTRADLAGRTVVARQSSACWQTLEALKAGGLNVRLQPAPETMETEDIIRMVAGGDYDLTVADNQTLDMERAWNDDIKAVFPLGDPQPYVWTVRAKDTRLLEAVNAFWKKEYRGKFYNITYQKYFNNTRKARLFIEDQINAKRRGQVSPYDDIVKYYAGEYDFDWRLIVSQMYQESRFNPKVKSAVGAQGLMQVMPRTARELGIRRLDDPKTGIHAGVKYLDWVRNTFEPEMDNQERMWFALAAYNAGKGHVGDARSLASQKGWNHQRWFDHVERAMLLLSKPQYARRARHGYVRGEEPVAYVRQIRTRYNAYVTMTTNVVSVAAAPTPKKGPGYRGGSRH